ncbi:sugar ABC transporter permease [Geotoga petraea]|uniref:Maltose/maltodextrin transport system permease protein n=1 Tax=Geotoga petraea TaxID=28234 RepID=A0A1G6MAD4_9BACT|nr:sugar ABC transporter permease [Geotoga petraea]SDC52244.1 maltose/maltodextrin transport system permease protein [Geotoga petraea]
MAKIEKKNYLFTHILIIFLIIIILFPMIWVVSTSIRRDAAAFSPRLFSDRVTINNYTDLIFQTPTVPEIMQDLNKVSTYIGEYSDFTYDEAVKESKEKLTSLKSYLQTTENNMKAIGEKFDFIYYEFNNGYDSELLKEVNQYVEENDLGMFNEMISEIKSEAENYGFNFPANDLEQITKEFLEYRDQLYSDYLELNIEDEIQKQETIKAIYDIPVRTTLWNIRVGRKNPDNELVQQFGEKLNELKNMYSNLESEVENTKTKIEGKLEENFSGLLVRENEFSNQLESLEKQISNLNGEKNALNKTIDGLDNQIQAVGDIYIPESNKIIASYDIIKNIDLSNIEPQAPMFGDNAEFKDLVSEYARKLPQFVENMETMEKYRDGTILSVMRNFSEVYRYLDNNFDKIFAAREEKQILPSFEALKNLTAKMAISLDELVILSERYNKTMSELNKISEELNNLRSEQVSINEEYKTFETKNRKTLNFMNQSLSYPNILVSKYFSESEIENFYESEYYAKFMESDFFKGFTPERNRYSLLLWKSSLDESYEKFTMGRNDMDDVISKIRSNIEVFENNIDDYLRINYGGNLSSIPALTDMRDVYISDFGPVNANIARSSRVISDLSYISDSYLADSMKEIDKDLYEIQHSWEERIRKPFLRWLFNSILVAGMTAIITVIITSLAAYPFSRMKFVGRSSGLYFLMIVQMFPIVMFMVAIYGILNFLGDYLPFIGLDTLGGLIFAYLGNVAYNMWLFKGYYDTIPDSLEESAMIDGATRFQTFWLIVLPLSLPIISVITILTFMNTFNEFVIAKIVLQSEVNYTYAVGLQTFSQGPFETQWGLFTAASLIGAIPMVILFLTMQKWIIGGLTQGSVKG